MAKVITVDQLSSPYIFELKNLLLGDKKGKYFVVTDDGLPLGRYESKIDADNHVESLTSPPDPVLSKLSTDELIEHANNLLKELE